MEFWRRRLADHNFWKISQRRGLPSRSYLQSLWLFYFLEYVVAPAALLVSHSTFPPSKYLVSDVFGRYTYSNSSGTTGFTFKDLPPPPPNLAIDRDAKFYPPNPSPSVKGRSPKRRRFISFWVCPVGGVLMLYRTEPCECPYWSLLALVGPIYWPLYFIKFHNLGRKEANVFCQPQLIVHCTLREKKTESIKLATEGKSQAQKTTTSLYFYLKMLRRAKISKEGKSKKSVNKTPKINVPVLIETRCVRPFDVILVLKKLESLKAIFFHPNFVKHRVHI